MIYRQYDWKTGFSIILSVDSQLYWMNESYMNENELAIHIIHSFFLICAPAILDVFLLATLRKIYFLENGSREFMVLPPP